MEWLIKIVDFFLREIWWRRYYKRVTIDEKPIFMGNCLHCDAGTANNKSIRCDIMHDRACPCKHNQCLKYK